MNSTMPTPTTQALWEPSAERIAASRLTAFLNWLKTHRGLAFADYESLWQWSVTDLEAFWGELWDYYGIHASHPYRHVLQEERMPGARWFEGAQLNFADQVFRHRGLETPAILFDSECVGKGEIGWAELERQVGAFAATLRTLGVGPGDRVCAYLPNVPHAVVAFLAVASLGAIWSISSPDMGVSNIINRFAQVEPKVLIACDGYRHGGKAYPRHTETKLLTEALPSLQAVIHVPLLVAEPPPAAAVTVLDWEAAITIDAPVQIAQLPFDHPLWILYSSGTTGLPKAIVHGHGGILMNMLLSCDIHTDLSPGDRFFWISSTGWMVWNVQISGLLVGATICLYDGSVTGNTGTADWNHIWRFVDQHRISTFGAGAAFYANCLKNGIRPSDDFELAGLRTLISTGSPLSPDCYRWIYDAVRRDIWLCCASGGTDIAGAFFNGTPTLPVFEGEMQSRNLGAAVYAFDDSGTPVYDQVGELVCTRPIPSMPLYFWGDHGNERYLDSYFNTFTTEDGRPIWRHGDWLKLVRHPKGTGGVIYGRSDSTINRQGIRMGTAEIYAAVEAVPEIIDSMVIDLEYLGRASYMALFVQLRPGSILDDRLDGCIRDAIRTNASARMVPNEIFAVPEIPRTLTGKKLEVPVKKLLLGYAEQLVSNRDTMSNPQSLDWFVEFAQRLNRS
ncbi:acetoacetate--CoA ligase [Parazoarcus communis]|nr:acetoacetate--CoA ligase [Parazoarcus communis]